MNIIHRLVACLVLSAIAGVAAYFAVSIQEIQAEQHNVETCRELVAAGYQCVRANGPDDMSPNK